MMKGVMLHRERIAKKIHFPAPMVFSGSDGFAMTGVTGPND
jgi:hypothetical protein